MIEVRFALENATRCFASCYCRLVRWRQLALEGLVATAIFALLAILLFDPLFADPMVTLLDSDRAWLGYFSGPRDRLAMQRDQTLAMWIWSFGWQTLTTAPTELFQPAVFHPAPDALAYAEHAIGALPVYGPVLAMTRSPIAAYQALLLSNIALSGAAMLVLLRHLGTGSLAAGLGGFVFAFAPARTDLLFHPHLLAMQWLLLAFVALDHARTSGKARWAVIAGGLLLLEMLSSYYLAYMALVATAAWLLGRFFDHTTHRRGWLAVGSAGVLAALPFALLSLPYLRVRAGEMLPDYAAIPGFLHWLSNGPVFNYFVPGWLLGEGGFRLTRGGHAWLGLLPLGLAALALRPSSRDLPGLDGKLAATLVLAAGWVFALGPELEIGGLALPQPWRLAASIVPGFSGMRAPHRFSLVVALGFSILVGLGTERLLRGPRLAAASTAMQSLVCAVLVGLIALDYGLVGAHWPVHTPALGSRQPQIYETLAGLPPAPLLELPLKDPEGVATARAMLATLDHHHPLLNGSSGYTPRSWTRLSNAAARLPDRAVLEALARTTGLRRILLHEERLSPTEREAWAVPAGLRLLARTRDPRTGDVVDSLWEIEAPPPADQLALTVACARRPEACDALDRALEATNFR